MSHPRSAEQVADWLREQGYWLEHRAARSLRSAGYMPVLGRVYQDPTTQKLRDIDVVATLHPGSFVPALRRLAVLECKAGYSGGWVVRLAHPPSDLATPVLLTTARAKGFLDENPQILEGSFPRDDPRLGFSAVVAGNADAGFRILQQTVSAAWGAIASPALGSAFAWPVLVITAPLYSLEYRDSDEPILTKQPYLRVLFSGAERLSGPILVDVVQHESLDPYLLEVLRPSLERLSSNMLTFGWSVDE